MKKYRSSHTNGQILLTLIVITTVGLTIILLGVVLNISLASNTSRMQEGVRSYALAESGAENALLRLLRDPNYTGETLTLPEGTAVATVSGTTTKIISVQGTVGNFTRTIQIILSYTNNILSVQSWKEI